MSIEEENSSPIREDKKLGRRRKRNTKKLEEIDLESPTSLSCSSDVSSIDKLQKHGKTNEKSIDMNMDVDTLTNSMKKLVIPRSLAFGRGKSKTWSLAKTGQFWKQNAPSNKNKKEERD